MVVDHNTIDHTGTLLISVYGGTPTVPHPIYGFRFTNNLSRHGTYGIFLSRLLPVWRAVVPPFAGIAGVSPARALMPLALASGLWYGAVTLLVVRLGTNLDEVVAVLGKVNRALGIGAVLLVVVGLLLVRRRMKR